MLTLLAILLLTTQQDMVEVIFRKEVGVIPACFEDICDDTFVLILFHRCGELTGSDVIPRQLNGFLLVLQGRWKIFEVFL